MKTLTSLFSILFSLASTLATADTYPKNPNIDILNYSFRITLSDDTDEIRSVAAIDVQFLAAGINVLRLDLVKKSPALADKGMTIESVAMGGKNLKYTHEGDELKIELPQPTQHHQRSTIVVSYRGVPATGLKIANNKYGDRTFFSDNWPDKGRNWLPMIDHPYDKATCEFIVTAPAHYEVVSNGLKLEETNLPDGLRLTHWRQSVPIASWLYVLGVAKFAIQYVDEFESKSIQTWVYYQDRDKGFYDFAEPTKKALAFYSGYVGPFVYEKLANIQSNSVSGGMEAASAILYSENSVVGDRNTRWRNVVIHEIAHQWFGNSVTEYDWDDVWLSEGFATYFTLLFIEHEYGRDAFLEGLKASKKQIEVFYNKQPDYRIIHDNLSDMSKVTTSQTYQKGSWILHMLRGIVGNDNFWKGIQSYYEKYMNKNATTLDFRREMEWASGTDLEYFFDQWLYKPGSLQYNGSWRYDKKKKEIVIQLTQVQKDGSLFKMPVQVAVHTASDKAPQITTLQVNELNNEFKIPSEIAPEAVALDPNGWVLMDATFIKK